MPLHEAMVKKAPDPTFNPFARVFHPDGTIDQSYLQQQVPALVEMLRKHPGCFPIRLDLDTLAARLLRDDAAELRENQDPAAFERSLARFSRDHLHELIDDDLTKLARTSFQSLADDVELDEDQRVAAAVGVALLGAMPDEHRVVGRSLFDLVFRITLEELHAQEKVLALAEGAEGGLSPQELTVFWDTYPALKFHLEERYRRDVNRVLERIEEGQLPPVVSVDLALRGVAAMNRAIAAQKAGDDSVGAGEVQAMLREPYEYDMLDGGRELVLARWRASAAAAREGTMEGVGDLDALETAIRITQHGGPGGDAILFCVYLRSIVEGQFHVHDDDEAKAARDVFSEEGLSPTGVRDFAEFHRGRGGDDAARRVALAALELWPDREEIRSEAVMLDESRMEEARAHRQGPRYDEDTAGGSGDGAADG